MLKSMHMAWNVFQWCKGLRVLGSFMILAVLGIVGVTYYSVVILNYGPQLLKGGSAFAAALPILIIFHVLLIMLLWCYFTTVYTNPGSVPPNWRPTTEEDDFEAQVVPLSTTPPSNVTNPNVERPTENGTFQNPNVRYCQKCSHFKPPRSHHCSVCGRCVLKMDHHCVWVVNCVGARNYKFFLLFLLYTFMETTLCTCSLLPRFVSFFRDMGSQPDNPAYLATTFIAFVLNVAFALSLLGFLILHTTLVCSNTTTIETHEKKNSPIWRYDMGAKQNFEQVFGTYKIYWFLPLYSQADKENMPVLEGLEYPIRPDIEE